MLSSSKLRMRLLPHLLKTSLLSAESSPGETPATPEVNVPDTQAEGEIPEAVAPGPAEVTPGNTGEVPGIPAEDETPAEGPATPEVMSEESEPEGLENSEDPEELIPQPVVEQHQRSITNRALLHMCIHMYAQAKLLEYELQEYKLQDYELPEYNLTEDGIAEPEPEEPEA